MDVKTAYFYGELDEEIYMWLPEGIQEFVRLPDGTEPIVHLKKSIYGLKQAGRQWYVWLSTYLTKQGYQNPPLFPCMFIKKFKDKSIVLLGIYVDDLILLGTPSAVEAIKNALKTEFEMSDLRDINFCLGLQIVRFPDGYFIHQSGYVTRLMEKYSVTEVDKIVGAPLEQRSPEPILDIYGPLREGEEPFDTSVSSLSRGLGKTHLLG